ARWSGMNLAFIAEPVFDLLDLRQRIERAAEFYLARGLAWTLIVCEDWIAPDLRESVAGLCRELLLSRAMETVSMTGRVAEEALPAGLEIRRVATPEMRREFADINAEGWDVPVEWTREILENEALWRGRIEAYTGYVGDEAVSVAMAYPVDGMSYLSWGATRVAHRRKGYAEAVVRHAALQNVGGPESLFFASPMGVKIWARMGFRIVSKFSMYISADKKD
ncbi:MAG: family acetyltransferase, partial [Bryobacterales bacterium]|nr:family acetyltransferase [Bryobacterales bacterium]